MRCWCRRSASGRGWRGRSRRVKADGDGPVRDADRETALLQHRSALASGSGSIRRSCGASSARSSMTRCAGSRTRCRPAPRMRRRKSGGVPGHRRRVRPPGRAAALRRGAAAGRLQGLRQLQGDARGRDRRARRSRDAADRKHHGRIGLRVVRSAAAVQPRRWSARRSSTCGTACSAWPMCRSSRCAAFTRIRRRCRSAASSSSTLPRLRGRERGEHRAGGEARARSEQPAPRRRLPARRPARISACTC